MFSRQALDIYTKILCPPGDGVYTVNTARDKREKLHRLMYGSTKGIEDRWLNCLKAFDDPKGVYVLGICSDAGGGILRGANWGPLGVRLALLESHRSLAIDDLGDIRTIPHFHHDKYLNDQTIRKCRHALYGDDGGKLPVSALSLTEALCDLFFADHPKAKLFSIGGDHSVSYPLVKSFLRAKKQQGKKVGLVHFDAHTDLLVERLGVDICFGSWVTHILPYMDSPSLVYQFGIRSSAKPKEYWEKTFGIRQFWAYEIKAKGIAHFVDTVASDLEKKKIDELYVSFDIDAIDSQFAGRTGTPEKDGLHPDEALAGLEALLGRFRPCACDLVEVAPFTLGEASPEDRTMQISADLAALMINSMQY